MAEATTKPAPEQICGNCAHYNAASVQDLSRGRCRRYPPTVVNDSLEADTPEARFVSRWCEVEEIDWCGEYKYKPPTDMT